jgi:hypothetical protein
VSEWLKGVYEMSEEYNIFISWSGERSKWVAEAMRDWLPLVIQTAKPWMSATNIEKGSRGLNEVSDKLQGVKIGIVCLTPENLEAPWILYEAGALSRTINDKPRLCTYLLGGLKFQDVKPPLGMFQATNPDKKDTRELMRTINGAVSKEPVLEATLDRLIDKWWSEFEQKLNAMPKSTETHVAKRTLDDMVSEILEIARAEADSMKSVQAQISHVENTLDRAPFGDTSMSMFTPGLYNPATNYGSPVTFFSQPPTAADGFLTAAIPFGDPERKGVLTVPVTQSEKDRKK